MHDQRQHIRVTAENIKQPIIVHVNGVNFLEIFHAKDISEGGIGIQVPHMFEGCKLDFTVSLIITLPAPLEHEIIVNGRIRHVVENRFGVRFLNLKSEDQSLIHRYVSYRLKEKPFLIRLKHFLHLI